MEEDVVDLQPIDQLSPVDEKMDLEMIDELVGSFYDDESPSSESNVLGPCSHGSFGNGG